MKRSQDEEYPKSGNLQRQSKFCGILIKFRKNVNQKQKMNARKKYNNRLRIKCLGKQ